MSALLSSSYKRGAESNNMFDSEIILRLHRACKGHQNARKQKFAAAVRAPSLEKGWILDLSQPSGGLFAAMFDEQARCEFVSGFRKRKLQRKAHGKALRDAADKKKRNDARKKRRLALRTVLARGVGGGDKILFDPFRRRPDSFVFLDLKTSSRRLGRVVLGLFDQVAPLTTDNFRTLCNGKHTTEDGSRLHYKDCPFHRVIPNVLIQGGDITQQDGSGGQSIYGEEFADETFVLRHTRAGVLSMANSGVDTNNSQFFVTLDAAPSLDEKHVVFGIVVDGLDFVKKAAEIVAKKRNENVFISDCGEIEWKYEPEDDENEEEEAEEEKRTKFDTKKAVVVVKTTTLALESSDEDKRPSKVVPPKFPPQKKRSVKTLKHSRGRKQKRRKVK